MPVRVQEEDFDLTAEVAQLRALQGARARQIGAIATFIGTVRDMNEGTGVSAMTLEHYPGMTERALEKIVLEARGRWDIFDARVIHRVGRLEPLDQIVLVVTVGHRLKVPLHFKLLDFFLPMKMMTRILELGLMEKALHLLLLLLLLLKSLLRHQHLQRRVAD